MSQPEHETLCAFCRSVIHQEEHGIWVDDTGGDDCPLYEENEISMPGVHQPQPEDQES